MHDRRPLPPFPVKRPDEDEEDFLDRCDREWGEYAKAEAEYQQSLVDAGKMEWFQITPNSRLLVHTRKPDCDISCVVHNPSDHKMRDWPLHWRGDRGLMERLCPHGVGHPDPDDIAFKKRTRGEAAATTEAVHGCDGCCMELNTINPPDDEGYRV